MPAKQPRRRRPGLRARPRPIAPPPERLEPRLALATDGPFRPIAPWDGTNTYDTGTAVSVSNLSPIQTWSVPDSTDLLLRYPNNKFVRLKADGTDSGVSIPINAGVIDLVVNTDGSILAWGSVTAAQTGWFGGGFDTGYNGGSRDGFVARIDKNGIVSWGTYIGGDGDDVVNAAQIVRAANGDERLVVVGTTSTTANFIGRSGLSDTIFDAAPSTGNSGGTAPAQTNGFVFVLGQNPGDTRFRQHVWSSYLSPNDPTTLKTLSPAGNFTAAEGQGLLSVSRYDPLKPARERQADAVTIKVDGAAAQAPAGGAAGGAPAPSTNRYIEFNEIGDTRTYEFRQIKESAQTDQVKNPIRRGNKLFSLDGDVTGEHDARRVDPANNIPPVAGQSGKRKVSCSEYRLDGGLVTLLQLWSVETEVSVRSMFVDSLEPGNPDRDAIYLAGTVFNDSVLPLGTRYGKYQQGYGDALIVELDLDGSPRRHQYVSGKGVFPEKGFAIGATDDPVDGSRRLLLFATRYAYPAPGTAISTIDSNYLYSYGLDQLTPSKSEIDVGGVVGGNYAGIADGTAAASVAQGTDFGKSVVNGTGNERTFRIRNTGSEALSLGTPTLPTFLSLKTGTVFPASVAAGAEAEFTLVVLPDAVGQFTGTVIIPSNDADEGSYDFAVRAEVITPPPSTFSIAAAAATITEDNSGTKLATFTVTLAPGIPAPTGPLSVAYAAVGGTATSGVDFAATSGTLTFALGETSKTVTVPIVGDLVREFDETFRVVLSAPTGGAVVSSDSGSAGMTILTDDGFPEPLRIGASPASVRITEGNSGTKQAAVTVSLNQPWATAVSVNYATANGSALAGSDYTATSGRLTINPGATQGTILIPIRGDTTPEADETFTVRLSGATAGALITADATTVTIVNDDGSPPLPAIRVANATVIEGNSGSPKLVFTITLAQAYSQNITLTVNTVDGTARAGRDYTAFSGTVTILAGRTSATVSVNVIPNTVVDGNRTLSLRVLNGASLVATGVGTIQDDDVRVATRSAFMASPLTTAAFASLASQPQNTSSNSTGR